MSKNRLNKKERVILSVSFGLLVTGIASLITGPIEWSPPLSHGQETLVKVIDPNYTVAQLKGNTKVLSLSFDKRLYDPNSVQFVTLLRAATEVNDFKRSLITNVGDSNLYTMMIEYSPPIRTNTAAIVAYSISLISFCGSFVTLSLFFFFVQNASENVTSEDETRFKDRLIAFFKYYR